MRRRFYSLVLLAAGLLVGTNAWANLPQRPTPPMEPKAPEGVVLLDHGNLPQGLISRSSANAAPRRAAMADLMATLYRGGEKFKDYMYTDDDYPLLFGKEGDLQDGDSLVLAQDLYVSYIDFYKSIVLNLNGYTICGSEYGIYIECTGNFKVMNGSVQSKYYYQASSTNKSGSYGIYVGSGNVLIDNVDITSSDEEGPYYGVYISSGAVEMKNSNVYAYYYGVFNYLGTTITLSDNDIYGYCYGIETYSGTLNHKSGKLSSYYYALYAYSYYGYITVNIDGGVFENDPTSDYQLVFMHSYSTSYKSEANIKGGYFKGSGYDIYQYCSNITIKGGYFYKPENGTMFSDYQTKIKLEGGYYDKQDAIVTPAGYSFGKPQNDGLYGTLVYPLIQAKATTGGYGFASVEEALADVDFDGTIKLIGNVENATINKDVTLDLDIYSITGTLTVTDNAKVSVKSFDTGNIHDLVATKADVTLYGGNYDFQPSTKATLADGLDERADYPSAGKYMVCQAAVASIFRGEETPQEVIYWTLQDAIDDAQAGEKILIKKDISILNWVTVAKGKDITIDLNGHVVSGQRNPTKDWQLVMNNGTLTLMDNTDVNKDGTGKGKLSTANFHTADLSFSPNYGVYVINNAGNLTIESGLYESFGVGFATYCIQQGSGAYTTTINGGKFYTKGGSYAIRMFCPNTLDSKVYINGGVIGSLWVQSGSKFTLHIQNATILKNLGIEATTTDFDISLKNIIMGSDWTLTGDARTAYEAGKYVVDNVKISGYNLQGNLGDAAFKHLSNGQYQFEDAYMGNENANSWKKYYSEEEGYFAIPFPNNPAIVQVYKSGQANIRAFMPYIMDGYGLVCIDEENKWYEIRPTSGTTGEESGIYGELGNPWHQDKTWDLSETDVVPQDTTPVLIDHNVYVEEGQEASAASVIVEPDQTLTIQAGATLIVGDGGIVFNKEEDGQTPGKIVVEPGATLLDGANGIISEDTKNVVIQASETAQGTFLFDPEVSLNTHPFGTVELISRSGLRKYPNGQLVNYWHRFASPVMELKEENFTNDWDSYSITTGLQIAAGSYFQTQIFQWSSSLYNWERIDKKENYCDSIVPFQGYTMLNNCTWDDTHKGGVTYTFRGNLVGNHNDDLSFLSNGYNYFGNSYTAPINIKELLAAVDNKDINRTVYIWDAELQVFRGWSFEQLMYVDDETTPASIPSMQTFVMQLLNGNSATSQIDYVNAIWNPVVSAVKTVQAPKRAKQQVLDATLKINIAAANGEKDAVVMMKDARYSNELDNGADAEKYMNEGSINLYAHAAFANVSTLAQDEIEGTMLSLSTNDETDFVMTFSCVSGEQYAIKDNITGTITTISNGSFYAFSTNANSTDENRFEIVSVRRTPTDTETIDANTEANSKVKGIYSVTGQYLGEAQDWFKMPAGVYVMDGQKVVK